MFDSADPFLVRPFGAFLQNLEDPDTARHARTEADGRSLYLKPLIEETYETKWPCA